MHLRTFPLFATLSQQETERIVGDCDSVEFAAGSTFIEEGEKGEFIFFLVRGSVSVIAGADDGGEYELATIAAPAVIGELEALTGKSRSASVRARSDVDALRLSFTELRRRLQEGDPAMLRVFLHIAQVIAHRLTAMNDKFVELQRTGGPRYHELRDFQEKLLNEWTV